MFDLTDRTGGYPLGLCAPTVLLPAPVSVAYAVVRVCCGR